MSLAHRMLLVDAQKFALARVLAHAPLATVSAALERRAVTEAAAKELVSVRNNRGGKVGLFILVMRPTFVPGPDDQSLRGTLYQDLLVLEHPTINESSQGTGIEAEACALELLDLFAFAPLGNNSQQAYSPAADGAVVPDDTFDGFNAWRTRLRSAAACPRLERCGVPLLDPDEGSGAELVTITTATPGAGIYYTLDGTYPSSSNGTLYTAPFAPGAGATLLAAAEKTDLQQSGIAQAIYS